MAIHNLTLRMFFSRLSRLSGDVPGRSMRRILTLACCWTTLAILNIPTFTLAQDTTAPDLIDRIDSQLDIKPFGPDFQWGLVGYHIAFPSYRLQQAGDRVS